MKDTQAIESILDQYKTIAVVGFSSHPHKPSFFVAKYMQTHGYRIVPVNPNLAGQPSGLIGEVCYASLQDAAAHCGSRIEIVNVFRRSADVPPVVEDAIAVGAQVVWMQQDISNELAAIKARNAGLQVVMDACIKVEHALWEMKNPG